MLSLYNKVHSFIYNYEIKVAFLQIPVVRLKLINCFIFIFGKCRYEKKYSILVKRA